MEKYALIIVDMQNDFIDEGSTLAVKHIRDGLPRLKRFIEKIRKKVSIIVYTRHIYDGNPNPAEKQLFPEVVMKNLHKGTYGAAIHHSIKPRKDDVIIDKYRYDAFHNTRLDRVLRKRGVNDLIIVGTMTDVCCACTAHSAMMNDYRIIFVSDLNFTSDKFAHDATLKNIKSNFGRVRSSRQVLEGLDA